MTKTKQRLSKAEAEELTRSLGHLTGAATEIIDQYVNVLEVPRSMRMEPDEWVQEHLGGYAKRSRDQLRDEVRQLDSMRDEEGNSVKRTGQQIGDVVGLSENSVKRYRAEIKAEDKRALESTARSSQEPDKGKESTARPVKLSPEDRRAEVIKGTAKGKSDADMALDFGVSITTIQKDRAQVKKEKLKTVVPDETGDVASRGTPQAIDAAKRSDLPSEIMSLAGRLRMELEKVPGFMDEFGAIEDEDLGNTGDHMRQVLTEQKDETNQAFDDALEIIGEALEQPA